MPTFTIEYRDERHRIALEQAIAYVTELHHIAQDAPRGSALDACEKLALGDGRSECVALVRDAGNVFHLDVGPVASDRREVEAFVQPHGPIERLDAEPDRLAGLGGLVQHRPQERATDPLIPVPGQEADVYHADQVGAAMQEEAARRLTAVEDHLITRARETLAVGGILGDELHPEKSRLVVVVPVDEPELLGAGARKNPVQERLIRGDGGAETDRAGQGPLHAVHQGSSQHGGPVRLQVNDFMCHCERTSGSEFDWSNSP